MWLCVYRVPAPPFRARELHIDYPFSGSICVDHKSYIVIPLWMPLLVAHTRKLFVCRRCLILVPKHGKPSCFRLVHIVKRVKLHPCTTASDCFRVPLLFPCTLFHFCARKSIGGGSLLAKPFSSTQLERNSLDCKNRTSSSISRERREDGRC